MTRKKRPVYIHQEVLTVHATCGLPNVCSEQLVTDVKVEEDDSVENNVSPKKIKESFQLPAMTNKKCLEACYSGTSSLPLLTNHSPVACSVVKHKNTVAEDGEVDNVTTLDLHTNATTPSDVTSMSIGPYESSSPNSCHSLLSLDSSPTHNLSGSATPTIRSDNTTPNCRSGNASPTHNIQKEQLTNSPLLTGKVERLAELIEKMSAKILLLETRLQLMEGNTHQQQEPVTVSSEITPSSLPPQVNSCVQLDYSPPKSVTVPAQQPSPPIILQQSLPTAQHNTQFLYRANSPETKQLIESLRNRAKQTKQLLAAATSDY